MGTRKLLALFGGICLVLILVVSLTGWVSALGLAKEEAPPPEVLAPSIMPVVVLEGSDYEMGYQYGQQAGQAMEFRKDASWASALRSFSYDEVLDQLKVGQYYVRMSTPEQIETMKGIADGATAAGYALSYLDVLMLNGCRQSPKKDYPYPPGAEEENLPPKNCSVWSAWGSTTTDGSLICGDSWDSSFTHMVCIVAFPDEGNNYVMTCPTGSMEGSPAMNNKGVFISDSGGFARRSIDRGYGLPSAAAYPHLLRFADSASEAKDMFVSWQYGGSSNYHFSDVNGDAYVVEVTAAVTEVRQPGKYTTGEEEYGVGETDFIYSTNNYFSEMGLVCSLCDVFTEHAGWFEYGWAISPQSRNLEIWNMLHNYQGEVDLEFAKMLWRHPGESPPYPLDTDAYYDPAASGEGWDPQICTLDTRHLGIAVPDDGNKGKMYICTGPAGRIAYPLGPTLGHHHYQIAGTHTFYQIALTSSPSRVVSAANDEAHEYIAEAYQELMWLNYTDTGFTGLNELYSLANAEYYEGDYWTNQAALTSGSEALLYYAKALTAYTRSQAHAKQVYYALVPPAINPEDLGLRPWFGFWGDWATRDIYPD